VYPVRIGCVALIVLALACSGCKRGARSSTTGADSAGSSGATGATAAMLQPNAWHITTLESASHDSHIYDVPTLRNSELDASFSPSRKRATLRVRVPPRLTIEASFPDAFPKLVPISATETTSRYGHVLITLDNPADGVSFKCSNGVDALGAAAPVRGKFQLKIDSARFAYPMPDDARQFLVHGSLHAECPGANATTRGQLTIDATF
jgi:hypothetical protein